MALLNFNAEQVAPIQSYDALPKGKYLAMAIASELKATKSNTGEYLQLTFEIIDGQFKGRKIFDRLNIRNSNRVAEEIGQRQLSALCHAVNVLSLTDSDLLHDIPVVLDIGIEDGRDGYEAQNRVKGYSSARGETPKATTRPAANEERAPVPAATGTAPAATGTAGKPVWKR